MDLGYFVSAIEKKSLKKASNMPGGNPDQSVFKGVTDVRRKRTGTGTTRRRQGQRVKCTTWRETLQKHLHAKLHEAHFITVIFLHAVPEEELQHQQCFAQRRGRSFNNAPTNGEKLASAGATTTSSPQNQTSHGETGPVSAKPDQSP